MATPTLPVLNANAPWLGFPGIAWDVTKSIALGNDVSRTKTNRRSAVIRWTRPQYTFKFVFNLLRDQRAIARNVAKSAPFNELDTVHGFFLEQYGNALPFFITDPTDYFVTNQLIRAAAAAGQTAVQMVRSVGSSTPFPIGGVNATGLVVRVNGGVVSSGDYTINYPYDGWITFDTPLSGGDEVRADMRYFFKVAFVKAQLDLHTMYEDKWEGKQIDFETAWP